MLNYFTFCVIIEIMTTRDPVPPSKEADPLLESARRLHDALTAPFDRPFDSLGYQASFEYTPSPECPVFTEGGIWSILERETDLKPVQKQPWKVKLGHDPRRDKIVTTSLEVPVDANSGQARLMLQRIAETAEYLMLLRDDQDSEPKLLDTEADEFDKIVYGKHGDAHTLSEGYVDRLLVSAGYIAPEVFTNPDDLQEHIADTLGTATVWSRIEKIVRVIDEVTTINLERTSVVLPTTQFAEETEEYVRQSDGTVKATIQYHNDSGNRGDLVITFDYTDHFVSLPRIVKQVVVPAFDDKVIANHGVGAHQIVRSDSLKLNSEAIDELAEELAVEL